MRRFVGAVGVLLACFGVLVLVTEQIRVGANINDGFGMVWGGLAVIGLCLCAFAMKIMR